MPVAFDEYNGSPTFAAEPRSRSAKRRGSIAWGDREPLIAELFPNAVGGVPQLPKLLPGSSVMRAASVAIKPIHDDALMASCSVGGASLATYDLADVEIDYRTLDEDHIDTGTDNADDPTGGGDPMSDPVGAIRVAIGGEFMTLPGLKLKWASDNEEANGEDVAPGKVILMIEIQISLFRVTSVPWGAIRSNVGKVNSGTYLGCAPETLLYMGADVQRDLFYGAASQFYRVEHRWQQKLIDGTFGWNYFWRNKTAKWDKLKAADGSFIYVPGGMAGIL